MWREMDFASTVSLRKSAPGSDQLCVDGEEGLEHGVLDVDLSLAEWMPKKVQTLYSKFYAKEFKALLFVHFEPKTVFPKSSKFLNSGSESIYVGGSTNHLHQHGT